MAIQYSGTTTTNTTFTSNNTGAQIISQLESALNTSGWTTISGHGTTDILVESATTAQGCKIRFRLQDLTGVNAEITMKDSGGSLESSGGFLGAATGNVFRIVCNAYQFFIYNTAIVPASCVLAVKNFAAGGVPWVPSFVSSMLSDFNLGWFQYNGIITGDAGSSACFRSTVSITGASSLNPAGSSMFNSNLVNYTRNTTAHYGPSLCLSQSVSNNNAVLSQLQRWEDNSFIVGESLLSWATGSAAGGEPRIKGMMWDAIVVQTGYVGDSIISYDSHNFLSITYNNAGVAGAWPGSLFVAVT